MTTAVNVTLVRFGPLDNGKLAATLATLAMILGLAFGPVLSGMALQLNLYPASLPFWSIMALVAVAALGVLALWPRHTLRPKPPLIQYKRRYVKACGYWSALPLVRMVGVFQLVVHGLRFRDWPWRSRTATGLE